MDIIHIFNNLTIGSKEEIDKYIINDPVSYLNYLISHKDYREFEKIFHIVHTKLEYDDILYLIQRSIKQNDSVVYLILQKYLK